DLLLGLQVYFKAGLLTALARADVKLGFDRRRARDFNWLFTTHRIPARPAAHVQDQYFEFLEYLGVDPHPVEWGITLTDAERERQRAFFERLNRPVCGIVVGTSDPLKNWAPERYVRLIEALEAERGFTTVLIGGPSADERRAADAILAAGTLTIDALGDDVRRLLYRLDGCDLVVSPEAGARPIARGLDVPGVGRYGNTSSLRQGPYGTSGDLLVDGYARWRGEDCPVSMERRRGGMDRVTVDAVLEKVQVAVERYLR